MLVLGAVAVALLVFIIGTLADKPAVDEPAPAPAYTTAPQPAPAPAAPADVQPAVEPPQSKPAPTASQSMSVQWTSTAGAAFVNVDSVKMAAIAEVEASLSRAGAKRIAETDPGDFLYAVYKYRFPDGSFLWVEYEDDIGSAKRGKDVRLSRLWDPDAEY
jgi:hypothetical protein